MASEKQKLMIVSNAPWGGTGYATQCAAFALRLKEHYDLAIHAFWGLEGGIIPWNGIPVLPSADPQGYANDTVREHLNVFAGGMNDALILTLLDVWVLRPEVWSDLNVACWVPVDHQPAPDPVANFFRNTGAVPIAMSRFGEKMLDDLDPLYCPHGINTEAYRPHDKVKTRKALGLPESAYIVGMVAANKGNPSRKCFAEAIEAFKIFRDRHQEAKLYLHTEATGRFGGVDLPGLIHKLGLDSEAVIFSDQYRAVHFPHPEEKMGEVMSCFDVLLSPSAGEGFGIPVVEAQACGVPVIVSDFSAQPELVGAGWLVEGVRQYTAIGSWQFKPAVEDIVQALIKCYRRTEREVEAGVEKARTKALEYDVDEVFTDYMLPALEEAGERTKARRPEVVK